MFSVTFLWRYIELNPVRAAMVAQPSDYRWSSVHGDLELRADARLTLHAGYLALGPDASERERAYRRLLMEAFSDEVLADIRSHMQQERALGSPRFRSMLDGLPQSCTVLRRSATGCTGGSN